LLNVGLSGKSDWNPCLFNAYVHITESVTDETAREVNGDKRVVAVSLVTSKARVSPLRTESIARIELAACVIATRIRNWVAQAYGLNPKDVCCLTDLTNCLFLITCPSSVKVLATNHNGKVQNESKNWHASLLISVQLTSPLDSQKSKIWKIISFGANGPAILRIFTFDRKVENVIENKMLHAKAQMWRALKLKVRRSQWETEKIKELTIALKTKTNSQWCLYLSYLFSLHC
jgi:hypothetical protein